MTENEINEIIIYDALASIMDNSSILCAFINEHGTEKEKQAYKDGVYAPAIKLQCVLGSEAMERGKKRHEEIKRQAEEFFKGKISE